jgi:hypothetical protein
MQKNTYNQNCNQINTTPPETIQPPIWYKKFVERESGGNEKIAKIMFQLLTPMTLEQWCSIWVPQFHNIKPGQYGYKASCVNTLISLTGYSESAVIYWLRKTNARKHLPSLGFILRLLHVFFLLIRAYVRVISKE